MGLLSLRQSHLRQPYYQCPLDTGHWAYKNLVLAYSMRRGEVDGKNPGNIGSIAGTMIKGESELGGTVTPTTSSSYIQFPNLDDYNTLGEVSVIALIRPTSSLAQQAIVTKCETSGGANTPFGFFVSNLNVSLNRSNTGGGTPFRVWASAASITSDTNTVIAATQGADISVAPRFYINGTFDTGSASNLFGGTGTGAPTSNTTSVKIGNRTDLGSQNFGAIYDVLVFNRVLSDAEIKELSNNIWAVWQAAPYNIFLTSAFNSYVITPTGGIVFSGTQNLVKGRVFVPSGGVVLSGTASLAGMNSYLITPTGGVTLSGTSAFIKTRIQIPTGTIVFSGSAPIESNTVVSVTSTQILLTGAGK